MQETIKVINNLQLCDEERVFENDVIVEGNVVLKNSKLTVNGMMWVRNTECVHSTMSMEKSSITAGVVLIDPILDKYENSKITATEFSSFSY